MFSNPNVWPSYYSPSYYWPTRLTQIIHSGSLLTTILLYRVQVRTIH